MKRRKLRKSIYDCMVICGVGLFISCTATLGLLALDVDNSPSLIGADIWYANQIEVDNTENNILEEISVKEDSIDTRDKRDLTIEEMIHEACIFYDIPYDICLAIAILETGWFTSNAYIYGNNPGGMSINEVPITYGSIEEGVDAFVKNLAMNYFSIGLDTPEKIGAKYCPANPDWDDIVVELMETEVE